MFVKIKDYLKKNEDKTLLGMAWSLYWRLWVAITAVAISLWLVFAVFSILLAGN